MSKFICNMLDWYQARIGSYDKQSWEKSLDSQLIRNNLYCVPKKSTKIEDVLIDIDLVKGSTFSKTKSKTGLCQVFFNALIKLIFYPFYLKWWQYQTSKLFAFILLIIYILQLTNFLLYNLITFKYKSKQIFTLNEIATPSLLMVLLGIMYSYITSAIPNTSGHHYHHHHHYSHNHNLQQQQQQQMNQQHQQLSSNQNEFFQEACDISEDADTDFDKQKKSARQRLKKLRRNSMSGKYSLNVETGSLIASTDQQADTSDLKCYLRKRHVIKQSKSEANFDNIKMTGATNDEKETTKQQHKHKDETKSRRAQVLDENERNYSSCSSVSEEEEDDDDDDDDDDVDFDYRDQFDENVETESKNKSDESNTYVRSSCHTTTEDEEREYSSSYSMSNSENSGLSMMDDCICKYEEMESKIKKEKAERAANSNTTTNNNNVMLTNFNKPNVNNASEIKETTIQSQLTVISPISSYTCEAKNLNRVDENSNDNEKSSSPITLLSSVETSSCVRKSMPLIYTLPSLNSMSTDAVKHTNMKTVSSKTKKKTTFKLNLPSNKQHKQQKDDEKSTMKTTQVDHVSPASGNCKKISCLLWEPNEWKGVDLNVLEISNFIISNVKDLSFKLDYFYIGLVFSTLIAATPIYFISNRAGLNKSMSTLDYLNAKNANDSTSNTSLPPSQEHIKRPLLHSIQNSSSIMFTLFSMLPQNALADRFFDWLEQCVNIELKDGYIMLNTIVSTFILCILFFSLLTIAERTLSQRFLHAKYFCSLTSNRKARKHNLPHFRLNKVENIRTWLSVRSYMRRKGPQRSIDAIISSTFFFGVGLLSIVCIRFLQDSDFLSDSLLSWQLVTWCLCIWTFMLRFMTIGFKINKKYRNCMSTVITEQINLYLQIEKMPEKKDELIVVNNVLKLASDLLKEVEGPFKISGLGVDPWLYNITKVIILSAFSAVLSELFGFKLKLHKIKIV